MLVNGKHIRGMYLYDSSLTFERGDFVIYRNSIYICMPEDETQEVKGEFPGESENYKLYPGEFATIEDYKNYISDLNQSRVVLDNNKYVSSNALFGILQNTFFGLNSNGIIDVTIGDKHYESLDILMESGTLNNGLVKVERESVMNDIPELYLSSIPTDAKYVIVRQSTYVNGDLDASETMRVQELLDPYSGILVCRSHKVGDSYISPWKSCIESDQLLAAKFRHIKEWYQANVSVTRSLNEFYFSKVPYESVSGGYRINLTTLPDNFVTVSFELSEEEGISKAFSASFDVSFGNLYKVSGVDVWVNKSGDYSTISLPSGYTMTDIYCRNYYQA